METRTALREIVAGVFEVDPAAIGPDFPLQSKTVKGSIGRGMLTGAIRKKLKRDFPSAFRFRNFAELEAAVNNGAGHGHGIPGPADGMSAPSTPVRTLPSDNPLELDALCCGLDMEPVANLPACEDYSSHDFYLANFTPAEIAYCAGQVNPRTHFAARWCAKEALRKSDREWAELAMDKIQVVHGDTGRPRLEVLTPQGPQALPHAVSLSHTEALAAAVVVGLAGRHEPAR